jgi:hypothetical protein
MKEVPVGPPGQIRVMAGIRPILTTDKATVIEFRDKFRDLMALFCRHFNDDMWIFITKDDPDWESHLVRLGYLSSSITAEQLVTDFMHEGVK